MRKAPLPGGSGSSVPHCGKETAIRAAGNANESRQNGPEVAMTFEAGSEQADSLRGAISFIFTLIAFHDELMKPDTAGPQ